MASREIKVEVDIIGRPQYRRLVECLGSVEDYARLCADDDLQEIVDAARADLRWMR